MSNAPLPRRVRRGAAVAAIAAILVLVGCSTGVSVTTPPATDTLATSSPIPSPSTGVPSATPGGVGQIDHPTEPDAVVLRMHVGGGFVSLEFSLTESPVFTLYGDNTVIFRPSLTERERMGGPGMLAPYQRATMNSDQVDALLRFALGEGGLHEAEEEYLDVGVADAPNTFFTIDAGGVQKTVTIAALGFDEQGPDGRMRARFFRLADILDSFEEQVAAGQVQSSELHRPEAYVAYLTDAFAGAGPEEEWPWPDLSVADFPVRGEVGGSATLSPAHVSALRDEPTGSVIGLLLRAPDGHLYQLSLKPLLPDEMGPA